MNDKKAKNQPQPPLLYYRTIEEMVAYKNKPVEEKLAWLQAQMEFFYRVRNERKENS
jgi:hypothetical protein